MKIGLWCAYHVTLGPTEGIGVFVHNLALGLAHLPHPPEITLVSKPGEESLLAETVAKGNGRITAIAQPRLNSAKRRSFRFSKKIAAQAGRIAKFARRIKRFARRQTVGNLLQRLLPSVLQNQRQYIWGKLLVLSIAFALFPLVISLLLTLRLIGILATETEDFFAWLGNGCQQNIDHCNSILQRMEEEQLAKCDLWVIPYVGLDREFPTATVVTIHDLVTYHFPAMLPAETLASMKQMFQRVADRATIAACMSNFIRDNDLYGQLHLSPEKVRVVKPATPQDFGEMAKADDVDLPFLHQPYVFYPSAFRHYKNHETLIRAVAVARKNIPDLQLVFTGISQVTPEISHTIAACGIGDAVQILKKVDRPTLAFLYHKALATIVPSLYEQGSFPIMEALHWGCPAACSDIPSLREQFEAMGSAMRYFDPKNEFELAKLIENIAQNRETILAEQQAAKEAFSQRTWTDAAAEWIDVFEDAIRLHRKQTERTQLRLAG